MLIVSVAECFGISLQFLMDVKLIMVFIFILSNQLYLKEKSNQEAKQRILMFGKNV